MNALQPTLTDRLLASVAPKFAVRRFHARMALSLTGQYAGARSNRTALKRWFTSPGSADTDTLGDLPTLRSRSRDLTRNNPLATGARATSKSNVIGTGLRARSKINHELLGISEEVASAWERRTETLFDLWAESKFSDITITQNFYELQGLLFDTVFESGDALVLRRKPKHRSIVPLALNIVEADRLATPMELANDFYIRDGVRLDEDGAPVAYCILNDHPAEALVPGSGGYKEVPAYGEQSGERMVLHVFERKRPGLSRGVPMLAPVIETLKQLDRFTEAELMKAVVSSFFTVFLKTNDNSGLAPTPSAIPGLGSNEVELGSGSVVEIGNDEAIETAAPANTTNFDPFFTAIVRQIGVALSIPFELLMMHFEASYSASKAAIEIATQFFKERRMWLVRNFCAPVYEWFVADAINAGLISAPGFYTDPVKRAAWLGAQWIGPARITLEPLREIKAEAEAVSLGVKTLEEVSIERSGTPIEAQTRQRGKEHKARFEAKLEPEVLSSLNTMPPPPEPANDAGGSKPKPKGNG